MAFSSAAAGGSRLPLATRICMRPCRWREQSNCCCCCCFGAPERVNRKERASLEGEATATRRGNTVVVLAECKKKKELLLSGLSSLSLAPTFTPSLSQLSSHNSLSSTSSFPVVVDLLRHLCEEPGQRDCRAQRTGESSRAHLQSQHVRVARASTPRKEEGERGRRRWRRKGLRRTGGEEAGRSHRSAVVTSVGA